MIKHIVIAKYKKLQNGKPIGLNKSFVRQVVNFQFISMFHHYEDYLP